MRKEQSFEIKNDITDDIMMIMILTVIICSIDVQQNFP